MDTRASLAPIALLAALAPPGAFAGAADIERGDDLHFEHCTGCHDASVYTRENRNVDSLERLGQQVRFCVNTIGVQWFDDEIDDVIEFLNHEYYRF